MDMSEETRGAREPEPSAGHPRAPETWFASAARSNGEQIHESQKALQEARFTLSIFDCLPQHLMVLNENRQVLTANKALREHLASQGLELAPGSRPGEVLSCVHADEMEGGCGTSESCRHCGAVQAVLEAQRGRAVVRECRLLLKGPDGVEAADLQVAASPLPGENPGHVLVTLTNLADEKRRKAMERVFFHDILNTAGMVSGYASLLRQGGVVDPQKGLDRMAEAAQKMVGEIRSQRDLMAAEEGTLTVQADRVVPGAALRRAVELLEGASVARGRHLEIRAGLPPNPIYTDPALLGRVLGNMVRNALEATPEGGTVTLGCTAHEKGVVFWVHNAAAMPRKVQLQVFQRSFSTKGADRGLGTYGMRLLGENYLGGRVSFTSNTAEGTTFRFFVPWRPPGIPEPEAQAAGGDA